NIHKNRYGHFLPLDATRVVLGDPVKDQGYINANFIDGEVEGSKKSYIACQAPLKNTLEDFWQMIWEQQCGVIVMLTSLQEGATIKAEPYWPLTEGHIENYGKFAVCHKRTFQMGELFIRSLLVKQAKS